MSNTRTTHALTPSVLFFISALLGLSSIICAALNTSILIEWQIVSVLSTPIYISFIIDYISLTYSFVVLFISANVMLFSKFYMHDDPMIDRFTILVLTFVASMNLLIFIPHFMALLLGWDGLGITSFILVIYYQNPKSLAAGMITAMTNRIGDVMILIAIAMTLSQGHWNILLIAYSPELKAQTLMILLAGMTKSAQMPFSSWLPAAMAAPTPVSALVHSSTLVTAGVFLLIRFYHFLSCNPMFNSLLLLIAVSTMLMAGISAVTECDMKKIIALSTLSQLGMMMTALALGNPTFALFHMMTHAMFKALLFICAGELIALHSHAQELRWMGNLTSQTPVAASCMLIANFALCGIPFMAGFYSKDLIMELFLTGPFNFLLLSLAFAAVGLTSLYSLRFSAAIIWGPHLHIPLHSNNENNMVVLPMLLMAFTSITVGCIILWTQPSPIHLMIMSTNLKFAPLLMVALGISAGVVLLHNNKKEAYSYHAAPMNFLSCQMWFLVPLASQFQLYAPFSCGHLMLKAVDHSWLEYLSGAGIHSSITRTSMNLTLEASTSPVSTLLLSCAASATLILCYLLIC